MRNRFSAVSTTPENLKAGLGLPSKLIRRENGAFWKRSSNRRNLQLKTLAVGFRLDRKQFVNRVLRNDVVTIIIWFPGVRFSQTQIQNNRWLLRFKIPPSRWSGDVMKRPGHKNFNAVSHNRARPEVLFSNLSWRRISSVLLQLLLSPFMR